MVEQCCSRTSQCKWECTVGHSFIFSGLCSAGKWFNMKRPLGVSLISYFYLFGAVVLVVTVLSLNVNSSGIGMAARFGLPRFSEQFFRILLAAVTLSLYMAI